MYNLSVLGVMQCIALYCMISSLELAREKNSFWRSSLPRKPRDRYVLTVIILCTVGCVFNYQCSHRLRCGGTKESLLVGPRRIIFSTIWFCPYTQLHSLCQTNPFHAMLERKHFFREVILKSAYKWILLQLIIFFILISVPFCLLFCVQNQIIARKFARKRVRNGLEESLQFLAWARRRCCSIQRISPEDGFAVKNSTNLSLVWEEPLKKTSNTFGVT